VSSRAQKGLAQLQAEMMQQLEERKALHAKLLGNNLTLSWLEEGQMEPQSAKINVQK
jgi:hypothetical protein